MSAYERVQAIGGSIAEVIAEHQRQIEDAKGATRDQQVQVGAMNISVNAVRTEVLGRIDACELKVLEKLGVIEAQLTSIALVLGTNGSGGRHV